MNIPIYDWLSYICPCNSKNCLLNKDDEKIIISVPRPKHRKCRACDIKYNLLCRISEFNDNLFGEMKSKRTSISSKDDKNVKSLTLATSKRYNSDPPLNGNKNKEPWAPICDSNGRDIPISSSDPSQPKRVKKPVKPKQKDKSTRSSSVSQVEDNDKSNVEYKINQNRIIEDAMSCGCNDVDDDNNRIYYNFKGFIKPKKPITNDYVSGEDYNGEYVKAIQYTLLTTYTNCECCDMRGIQTHYTHYDDNDGCCCLGEESY